MRLKVGADLYALYFPQERPLTGQAIRVWNERGELLGDGVGSHLRASGGSITINGKTFDSNHVLHWLPVEGLEDA